MTKKALKLLAVFGVLMIPLSASAGNDGHNHGPNITADEVNAVAKMTVEDLKKRIDKKEKIAVIDSRTGNSWGHSKIKIKDAIRMLLVDTEKMAASKIPMGHKIVVYCT